MTGLITTIQRMSLNDGPGIRSTVFLKGCDLRCSWCHNPEAIFSFPEMEWIGSKCIDCHACVQKCPTPALSVRSGKLKFVREECTACFACLTECYTGALHRIGREVTPRELFNEIMQDEPFFRQSGGGVTISGGEPMMQRDFTATLLQMLREAGIHTALDTNMTSPWEKYETVLPFTSLVLADLKLIDEEAHRTWTGKRNRRILENIRRLDETGIPYYVRTPVIPGVNDDDDEMARIIGFVSGLKNMTKFDLLPFHAMGAFKYKNLGLQNPMEGVASLEKESLGRFAPILERYSVPMDKLNLSR